MIASIRKGDAIIKKALKIAYVAMSRPRYLLCVAIDKKKSNKKTIIIFQNCGMLLKCDKFLLCRKMFFLR